MIFKTSNKIYGIKIEIGSHRNWDESLGEDDMNCKKMVSN